MNINDNINSKTMDTKDINSKTMDSKTMDSKDMNIKTMYAFQLHDLNSELYKKYLSYIDKFFKKKVSKKNEVYDKKYLDGKYILIDRKDKSKKIVITPSQFINMNELYFSMNTECNKLLYEITLLIETKSNINDEHRQKFDELKNKYLIMKEKLNDIQLINDDFYKITQELLDVKIKESNNLAKYYQIRNISYEKIKTMISEKDKNELILLFKKNQNKIPIQTEINRIAKKYKISSNDIENWFSWIEASYLYLLVKRDINELDKEIMKEENKFDFNTKYMIIKKPIISK